jgi:hypothetical protein
VCVCVCLSLSLSLTHGRHADSVPKLRERTDGAASRTNLQSRRGSCRKEHAREFKRRLALGNASDRSHVCSRMLTYAHVCAWQCQRQQRCTHFTYAHVCSRMLTYAPATAALHALHDSSYNAGSTLSAQRPLQLVDSGLFFFSDIQKKNLIMYY